MKRYILITTLLVPLAQSVPGQDTARRDYRVDVESYMYFEGYSNVRFKANTSAYGIKGTRFVFDEFVNADVYFSNKTIAPDRKMNYDSYFDQVVFSNSDGKFILDKFLIDYIEFKPGEDSTILFERIYLESEKDVVFMQVLHEGKSKLYKRYEKKLVVNDEQPTFNYGEKYANEYIINTDYYLKLSSSDEPERIPPKKRAFLKRIDQGERAVRNFIREKNLNLRREEDMIRLIKFYDRLTGTRSQPQTADQLSPGNSPDTGA